MKLVLKIFGYAFIGLVGLIVLAFIALQVISDDQYKKWITGAAESATGRALEIDGIFDVQIGSKIGLAAHDVSFANAVWGSRQEMITADRLLVQLKLLPLLKGMLDVTVELDAPDILMETNAEGTGNWLFTTGEEKSETQEAVEVPEKKGDGGSFKLPLKPYIRNFQVSDLVFVFNDGANDKQLEAAVETLRLFVDGEQIPLTLRATYQGAPIELDGSLGNIEQWYANETTPVSLQGMLNEAKLGLEGSAGPMLPEPNAQLDIVLAAADISTFGPFAGMVLPELQGLDAALTFLAADGRMGAENITLALNDPRLQLAAEGLVDNLAELSGIDVKAEINTEQAAELIKGLDLDIQYSLPQTVRLKAGVSGNLEQLAVRDLELLVKDSGLDVSLTGSLENVLGAGGGNADLSVSLESSSIIGGYIGQELPSFGPFEAVAKLSSSNENLQLESLQIDLRDSALTATIDGSAQQIGRSADDKFEISGIEINAEAATGQLGEILARAGLEVPAEVPSTVELKVGSAGSLDKLAITDLWATVKDAGLEVNLSGTVDNVIDLSGVAAQLTAVIDDTASLSRFAGVEVPALGSLNLNSNLSSADESYRLDDLELLLDGELIQAKVTAAIADLMALTKAAESTEAYAEAGIDVSIDMETGALAEIGKLAGVETIPDLGTLNIQGKLGSSEKSLALENLDLALTGADVEANVKAAVADLMVLKGVAEDRKNLGYAGIDVSLDASTFSVSNLVNKVSPGINLPELGSLELDGHLGSTEASLKLDKLRASLNQDGIETKADVVIEDLLKISGIKAVVDGNVDSLSTLSELAKKELPQTGPWVVNIKADTESPGSPVNIAAQLDGEGTKTVVEALLPDLMAPQTFETQLTVDVESLTRVGVLLGKKIPEDKSMKITGKAWGKPGEYHLEEFTVREEESEILANLAYTIAPAADKERNSLIGELTINNFDFTDYLAAKEETVKSETEQASDAESEAVETQIETVEEEIEAVENEMVAEQSTEEQQTEETPSTGKRIFSDEPLAVGVLRDYDVDLKIDLTNTRIQNGIDMNGKIAVSLDDGLLNVDPFDFDQTNGGSGTGYIKLDARNQEAVLDAALDFDNFVSPRFGGLFDLDLDLGGKGESLADLMGSLNGHFAAALKEIELEKTLMSQFGAGLLSNLNPLDSDKTTLECAVIRFEIEDGIADFHKKIAAQTTEVTWMGGGEINLKTEELDVGIAPKPRGAISGLTNLGLASLVHVGGTLAEPKVGLDVADVAKKYGEYSAFIATGGLSFLAKKLVDTAQANVDQCERILGDLNQEEDEESKTDAEK